MGRGYTEYVMLDSRRSECVLFSAFLNYRLSDGTKLPILQREGWCPNCDRFVVMERVPTIEELDEEVQRFQGQDADTLRMWDFQSNGQPIADRIAELSQYIEWRKRRKAPPHCLVCGSENPIPVPACGAFPHPETAERVIVGNSGWADAAPSAAEFSPEGIVIVDTS